MEKFNNIYMYCSCDEKKHIPEEIEKMYFNQYGREVKRKFFRTVKK